MSENSFLSGVAEDFSRLTLECASGQIVFRMNARALLCKRITSRVWL
jgi:hypothetical protein